MAIGVIVCCALSGGSAAATLTRPERQRLIAHLEMTMSWLSDEVSRLSSPQVQFRPAAGAWNILEVVEHLVVAEPIYWQDFQKAMKAPPRTGPHSGTDANVLWYGIDRTERQKAVPGEGVNGQLRDVAAGLNEFRKVRARMLEYVRTTEEDLRSHYVQREGSDAYQWLLLISAHAQRHILQIREIKADPKFPKG